MLSYKDNFSSDRPDGRHVCTVAAQMARMRNMKPELAFDPNMDSEALLKWKKAVREKARELLSLPAPTLQPEPVLLSTVQREGYRVEKWEFYPDDYSVVPFLALIPDCASAENPVPGMMCFLGSNHNKEFVAGEPMLEHPNCQVERYPERNRMAKYFAENGMAAFVFDNPAIGECSVMGDPAFGEMQGYSRVQLCYGYLQTGMNYTGVSVFQKLRFMEHLRKLCYIDQSRIGVSAHSLGTETAIYLALICEEIKAVVFNDGLTNPLKRFAGITEEPENAMSQDIGNWHVIPGQYRYFDLADLCAAFAPGWLGLTEGGGDESVGKVQEAYARLQAEDRLLVSYYPAYQNPQTRTNQGPMASFGLTQQDYFDYNYIVAPEHSFRKEPALKLLKRCFFQTEE